MPKLLLLCGVTIYLLEGDNDWANMLVVFGLISGIVTWAVDNFRGD